MGNVLGILRDLRRKWARANQKERELSAALKGTGTRLAPPRALEDASGNLRYARGAWPQIISDFFRALFSDEWNTFEGQKVRWREIT